MKAIKTVKNLAASGAILAGLSFAIVGLGAGLAHADTGNVPRADPNPVTAGKNDVNNAIDNIFGGHGQAYQAISASNNDFHDNFVPPASGSPANNGATPHSKTGIGSKRNPTR